MNSLKYNKTDYKTHFTTGVTSYMFRHQGAIISEFIRNKGCRSNRYEYKPLLLINSLIMAGWCRNTQDLSLDVKFVL